MSRVLLLISLFFTVAATAAERPNVLFILADDLGYGDLSCYGATRVSTPNIDQLAKEGRKFTQAYSPSSVCTPTRYNLLTGRYAWRTWVGGSTVWANDPLLIDPDRYTLADLFKKQGYATACIGKWHLGFGQPGMDGWDDVLGPDYNRDLKPGPLELGFDYFWGFPHVSQFPHYIAENYRVLGLDSNDPLRITPDKRPGFELDYLHRPRSGLAAALKQEGGGETRYTHEELSDRLTKRAVEWLDDYEAGEPFFLYLAHRNVHGPLVPAPRFDGTSEIGAYGDFLNEFDWSVGEVLKALDRNGLTEDTLVIFTSDNGGVLQYKPVDYPEVKGHRINGPLRGQKTTVYEGGVRVPFLVRWPGRIPEATIDTSMVALTDTFATFAEFFEEELPPNAAEDSFSFLGALLDREQTTPKRESLIMDSYREMMAIRRGPWKLIMGQHGGGANYRKTIDPARPVGQLFHLEKEAREWTSHYAKEPELVAELTAEYEKILRDGHSRPGATGTPTVIREDRP
ncbi:arylsulfatase [Verrucomicrobiales bacterium BCK34]|nr:arylsulfatase [Verrucomicrobiales bacterium BCK34]